MLHDYQREALAGALYLRRSEGKEAGAWLGTADASGSAVSGWTGSGGAAVAGRIAGPGRARLCSVKHAGAFTFLLGEEAMSRFEAAFRRDSRWAMIVAADDSTAR